MTHSPLLVSERSERGQQLLEGSEAYVYKQVNGLDLEAYVFPCEDRPSGFRVPVIAFFGGNNWDQAMVSQFGPYAKHFAGRGMVSVCFDYRVKGRHGTGPIEAIADARSAIRSLRFNADVLGVDPNHIVVAGGGSGGHIAACAALLGNEFDEAGEDPEIGCHPHAMVLFAPALDISPKGCGMESFPDKQQAQEASPLHHVRKELPPTLLMHGTADRFIPFAGSQKFARLMKRRKNVCELVPFEGKDHGFFNFNVDIGMFEATLNTADAFLVENGFLEPQDEESSRSYLL